MKFKTKRAVRKIISSIVLVCTVLSMGIAVYADGKIGRETVWIDGYECYIIDGQYYTEVNGEEYLFAKSELVENQEEIANLNELATINKIYTIDLTGGKVYHGYADATYSDATSTYFKVNLQDYTLNFHVDFWLNRKISMTCFYFIPDTLGNTSDVYDDLKGKWYHADLKFSMNLFAQTRKLLGDTVYKNAEVMYIVIHNQGTEPEKAFEYQLYLTKEFYE